MAVTGIGSNYNNNVHETTYAVQKNGTRNQKENVEAGIAKQFVTLSISDEGKEYYRNSVQQEGHESYDTVLQRRQQLKNEKISFIDYGLELQKKADTNAGGNILSTTDKANNYVTAYAELYDEMDLCQYFG